MSATQRLTPDTQNAYSAETLEPVQTSSGADARDAGWAVIRTHPQAERWAIANLQRQGYRCFLPTHVIRKRDRSLHTLTHLVSVPLFPCYAFVWINVAEPWGCIRNTFGVRKLLMDSTKPGFAPTAIVEALQASEAARQHPMPTDDPYQPGAAVKLTHGAFRNLRATITSIRGNAAVLVVMMFGGLREVTLPLNALIPDFEAAA